MSRDIVPDVIVPEKSTYGKDSDPGPGLGPEQWPEGSPQRIIYVFMEDSLWNRMVILATVWALFVPDTRTVTLNTPEYDSTIALGTLAALCVFLFELLANFYVGRDYGGLEGCNKITCVCAPMPSGLAKTVPCLDGRALLGRCRTLGYRSLTAGKVVADPSLLRCCIVRSCSSISSARPRLFRS